jgi:ABC-type nitrate/sulfonate/bicarbonate transport system substrate-binding protein
VGEVAASKHFAKQEGLDLKVVPGAEDVDPIKVVLSGAADFGVVGADLLVAAVAKGAPLVAIGVINLKTPTCFLVREDSPIKGPRDFVGKRVGILTGTNTERVYQLMMKRAGVDRTKVREIQVPFDLQTFVLKQYDVRPAFIYDEPVSLEGQSIPYRVINPADYGVQFLGTVYFTRKDVIDSRRDTVQKLVNSLARGWRFSLAKPDLAIADLVEAYPSLKRDRETRSFEIGKGYFAGEQGKPLTASEGAWQAMITSLEEISVIPPGSVRVSQVWIDEFARRANE